MGRMRVSLYNRNYQLSPLRLIHYVAIMPCDTDGRECCNILDNVGTTFSSCDTSPQILMSCIGIEEAYGRSAPSRRVPHCGLRCMPFRDPPRPRPLQLQRLQARMGQEVHAQALAPTTVYWSVEFILLSATAVVLIEWWIGLCVQSDRAERVQTPERAESFSSKT